MFKKKYYWVLTVPVFFFMNVFLCDLLKNRSPNVPNSESVALFIPRQTSDMVTGCQFPNLSPFSKVAMKYDEQMPKVVCYGQDWVVCNMSECRVHEEILQSLKKVVCHYKDIIYVNDNKYEIADPVTRHGDEVYKLNRSDGFKVSCSGISKKWYEIFPKRWFGYKAGIRQIKATQPDENTINVLIVGFDSTSHNGIIRKMPKSYKFLKTEMEAVILNGYNIVGDGTPDALFPILSGMNELQHPPAKRRYSNNIFLDTEPFIFHTAKLNGYETAYFEDMPWVGTFQYRFNGFLRQPADHYLRSFLTEETKSGQKWYSGIQNRYCLGEKPQYLFLLDLTRQFMKLNSKRFCFTFMGDISHDDFNQISTVEDDFVDFLKHVKTNLLEDTLVIVMGDHGQRFGPIRATFEGKVEERMAFMSIILPEKLKRERKDALNYLKQNADVLTTPFDIHTTILDAIGLKQHASDYAVPNSNMKRGLSLLEPISVLRTCADADILPYWCVCMNGDWKTVTKTDPKFTEAGVALLSYVNRATNDLRELCAERKLKLISWVLINENKDSRAGQKITNYQALIITSPGHGIFEGMMEYDNEKDLFLIKSDKDVSRISAYSNEPACISKLHPHLNKYCYCKYLL
ncbi:uncharacterized protein LOC116775662 isoform X2 [Danaus plexippus]|nr:uncharacterized protein LOC116775662 isoform X2 [Danaus plexippus]